MERVALALTPAAVLVAVEVQLLTSSLTCRATPSRERDSYVGRVGTHNLWGAVRATPHAQQSPNKMKK